MDLAEAHFRVGRITDAAAGATAAVKSARERGERGFEAWALRLQAEIALAADPANAPGAAARYREAMALAAELEMRPLLAHCHVGLGRLYRRTDNREQAQEHLTTATLMYRDMDMRFWLEQAERR